MENQAELFSFRQHHTSEQLSIWWVVINGVSNPSAREVNTAQDSSMLSVAPPTDVAAGLSRTT